MVRERSIAVTVRPVSIYAGGSAEAIVYVHGSGFRVVLSATPSDNCVEVVSIDPVNGRTPLQVRIVITVAPNARPGVYGVDIAVLDAEEKRALASSRIPVIVLNSPVVEKILEGVDRLRRIYRENGIQYAIIYALDMLGGGLSFSSIKQVYELIVGRRISNGTVGDLLRRLLRKGIVRHVNGRYYLSVDIETAKTIIDVKRARNGVKGARVAVAGAGIVDALTRVRKTKTFQCMSEEL